MAGPLEISRHLCGPESEVPVDVDDQSLMAIHTTQAPSTAKFAGSSVGNPNQTWTQITQAFNYAHVIQSSETPKDGLQTSLTVRSCVRKLGAQTLSLGFNIPGLGKKEGVVMDGDPAVDKQFTDLPDRLKTAMHEWSRLYSD